MSRPPLNTRFFARNPRGAIALAALLGLCVTGCQDGPLYAVKAANPWYSWKEWRDDTKIGVTDHERRKQLTLLAETVEDMSQEKQIFWAEQLEKMIDSDESPEMRRLAVRAASRMDVPTSLAMVEKGLDDASLKVRMEACQALGRREGEDASRMLVATIGTETDLDVKHAALQALSKQQNPVARDALKVALSDRNPATRHLAMDSLRDVTGKDYGDDPQVWIAALNGQAVEEPSTRIADRIRDIF